VGPRDPDERVAEVLRRVLAWAKARADVAGVLLVGSWARGAPRLGSDVDLVILVDEPDTLLVETSWVGAFGAERSRHREDWGAVQSLRVVYGDADDVSAGTVELELGIAAPSWAALDPVDPGTARVVADGWRIVHDPRGLLTALVARVVP
jgi:hypothetical protein